MKLGISISAAVVSLLGIAMLLTAGWERPPVQTQQLGYRGLGMVQVSNPRVLEAKLTTQVAPTPIPPIPGGGPLASSVYKNVQVLNDLEVGEFTRLMLAITAWVSPEQGCAYCHKEGEDLSADTLYTKVVARRMLQMNRHVNSQWKAHVGDTGVTCYTCHRGQPVPAQIWFRHAPLNQAGGLAAVRNEQNFASARVGFASLPYTSFENYLLGDKGIRVAAIDALPKSPVGQGATLQATEGTYGLMVHMSEGLGVNCTYCHNSQSFQHWNATRSTAWYGIRMVRDLNVAYLDPLQPTYPGDKLGPLGDAPKANCATCHQGLNKPLAGAQLLKDHPELAGVKTTAAAPAVMGTLEQVMFAVGSKSLSTDGQAAVVRAAKTITASANVNVDISGFADKTGNVNSNLELAKARAFAVRDALKSAGVAENRINLRKPEFVVGGTDSASRRVDIVASP